MTDHVRRVFVALRTDQSCAGRRVPTCGVGWFIQEVLVSYTHELHRLAAVGSIALRGFVPVLADPSWHIAT